MISKTYFRYIWLLDTVCNTEALTYNEIAKLWNSSPYNDGSGLSIRTFHEHRKGVEDMFGAKIECNKSKGYTYYLKNPEVLKQNPYAKWFLNKYSVPQDFVTFIMMKKHILLEEIPHGTSFVNIIIESIRTCRELVIDYQQYEGRRETFVLQPYALKVHNRRWYTLGYIKEKSDTRTIALERVIDIKLTSDKFAMPKDFNPKGYFDNVVGIYVDKSLPVEILKIRVYGVWAEYVRMLPLHKSQHEVGCHYGEYADFCYRVCLTPELRSKILEMGSDVEVLEPEYYREEIKNQIAKSLERYK